MALIDRRERTKIQNNHRSIHCLSMFIEFRILPESLDAATFAEERPDNARHAAALLAFALCVFAEHRA